MRLKVSGLLFGLETEYAISAVSPRGVVDREGILHSLMRAAREQLVHLPDLHSSGGVFLQNGSRLYIDCGVHPEFCTPEVSDPCDLVRYVQAGHSILTGLVSSVQASRRAGTEVMCFRCNVDYSGSHSTWGCHESYLHRISQEALQPQLVPHLVTRIIYTGAGGFNPFSLGLEFTLAPRMAHFRRVNTESSTTERGIWHEKSESLCEGYKRLHVLCGESLCTEAGNYLKVGVTALIVAMADAGLTPGTDVKLADPLAALHCVAGDVTAKTPLQLASGSCLTAAAIQCHYLEQAEAHLRDPFMPAWASRVCGLWRRVLDQIENGPDSVEQTLDWAIKRALYANHARSLGIQWEQLPFMNDVINRAAAALKTSGQPEKTTSLELALASRRSMPRGIAELEPLLQSRGMAWDDLRALLSSRESFFEIDTRFGQLGPKGIFQMLDHAGVLNHRVRGIEDFEQALTEPPALGRAHLRGQVVRRMAGADRVMCDWQHIFNYRDGQVLDLSDPFVEKESWRPLDQFEVRDGQMPRSFSGLHGFDRESGDSGGTSQYSRRVAALRCYQSGDYVGAETLLRRLVEEGYEVASNHCHIARALILMNRDDEARQHVRLALEGVGGASPYVMPRILFFQWIFTTLDGSGASFVASNIKTALEAPGASSEWTIQPMLDHLRPRLGLANFRFLRALAKVISDGQAVSRLDAFPQWRSTTLTQGQPQTGTCA